MFYLYLSCCSGLTAFIFCRSSNFAHKNCPTGIRPGRWRNGENQKKLSMRTTCDSRWIAWIWNPRLRLMCAAPCPCVSIFLIIIIIFSDIRRNRVSIQFVVARLFNSTLRVWCHHIRRLYRNGPNIVNIYFYDDDDDENDDVENVIFIRCASVLLNHLLITESISDIFYSSSAVFGLGSFLAILRMANHYIIIICGCAWMSLHLDLEQTRCRFRVQGNKNRMLLSASCTL